MNFVSSAELQRATRELIKEIPNRYDMIVGIPRSGLQIAALAAGVFGKPLATPEGLVWVPHTTRLSRGLTTALLVDDSIATGTTLKTAESALKTRFPGILQVHRAVIIAEPGAEREVHYHHSILPQPRFFEWNIAHGKWGRLGCDIDGVLCNDLPPGLFEQQSEEEYLAWIENAPPKFIPTYPVDVLITCRMKRRKTITQNWLERYGVKYKKLVLWGVESPAERAGKHADYKIAKIKENGCTYFFESNMEQATKIHEALKIPVLCFDEMVLLGGNNGLS